MCYFKQQFLHEINETISHILETIKMPRLFVRPIALLTWSGNSSSFAHYHNFDIIGS